MSDDDLQPAKEQGQAQYDSIRAMVERLKWSQAAGRMIEVNVLPMLPAKAAKPKRRDCPEIGGITSLGKWQAWACRPAQRGGPCKIDPHSRCHSLQRPGRSYRFRRYPPNLWTLPNR